MSETTEAEAGPVIPDRLLDLWVGYNRTARMNAWSVGLNLGLAAMSFYLLRDVFMANFTVPIHIALAAIGFWLWHRNRMRVSLSQATWFAGVRESDMRQRVLADWEQHLIDNPQCTVPPPPAAYM